MVVYAWRMRSTLRAIVLALLALVSPCHALGQTGLIRSDFTGAAWPASDELPRIVAQTGSSGSVFAETFFRTDLSGVALAEDTDAFFVRVAQTVRPMAEVGTVEQLLDVMVSDARGIAAQFGTAPEAITENDCSRRIAGSDRSGRAVAGNVVPGAESPRAGRFECYAFEQDGKGYGIIVKITTSDEAQLARDTRHAELMLAEMTPRPLAPMDAFPTVLYGASFDLPVASVMSNTRMLASNMGASDVEMPSARATLISASLGADREIADGYFESYRKQIIGESRVAISGAGESARLLEDRAMRLPVGDGSGLVIEVPTLVYRHTGQELGLVAALARRTEPAAFASLTVSLADPELAWANYRIVASGIARGSDEAARKAVRWLAPGVALGVDPEMSVTLAPGGGVELSTRWTGEGQTRIDSLRDRRGFVTLDVAPEGEGLDTLHTEFARELFNACVRGGLEPVLTREGPPVHVVPDANRRVLREWARTEYTSAREGATALDGITVSSAIVWSDTSQSRIVVHSVMPTPLRGFGLGLAEEIVARSQILEENELHSLGAVALSGELAGALWEARESSLHATTTYTATLGDCRVRVTVHADDPQNGMLAEGVLDERFMRRAAEAVMFDDEWGDFPQDPQELQRTSLAGRSARLYRQRFDGADENGEGERKAGASVRIYGFAHGEGYTTVSVVREGEADEARMDALAGMLVPGTE